MPTTNNPSWPHHRSSRELTPEEAIAKFLRSDEALDIAGEIRSDAIRQGRGPAYLYSENRDLRAALLNTIGDAMYQNSVTASKVRPMLMAELEIRQLGFADVTMYNMGVLSQGRLPKDPDPNFVPSNVQAALIREDSDINQPAYVIVIRGTKDDPKEWFADLPNHKQVKSDWDTHFAGVGDYWDGDVVRSYASEYDRFISAAGYTAEGTGIFDRIEKDIAEGRMPRIIIDAHSYGGYAGARLAGDIARKYPQLAADMEYISFGSVQTMPIAERAEIYKTMFMARYGIDESDRSQVPDDLDFLMQFAPRSLQFTPDMQQGPTQAVRYVGMKDPVAYDFTTFFSRGDMNAFGERVLMPGTHTRYSDMLLLRAIEQKVNDCIAHGDPSWVANFRAQLEEDPKAALNSIARDLTGNTISGFANWISSLRAQTAQRNPMTQGKAPPPEEAPRVPDVLPPSPPIPMPDGQAPDTVGLPPPPFMTGVEFDSSVKVTPGDTMDLTPASTQSPAVKEPNSGKFQK